MYQCPPQNVGFGQLWPDGKKFDDKYQLTAQPYPINLISIRVHYNKYIVGIGFKYKAADGAIVETSHNFCNGMLSKTYHNVYDREFFIEDGDFIKTIKGKSGDWLDKIEFITYKGANQSFGGTGGSNEFQYEFPGYTFSAVSGSYRDFIDSLQFQIIPLPDHYKQAFAFQDQKFTAGVQYPSSFRPLSQSIPNQPNIYYQPQQPINSNYVAPVQNFYPPQSQFPGQQNIPSSNNHQPQFFNIQPVPPQNLNPPLEVQQIGNQQYPLLPSNQIPQQPSYPYNQQPEQQQYYNGVNPNQNFGGQIQMNPDYNNNNNGNTGKYNYPVL